MSYKTILVYADDSPQLQARVGIAAKIAMDEEAHLIGIAVTGISQFIRDTVTIHPEDPAIAPYLGLMRQRAAKALDAFEKAAKAAGVTSCERRMIDEEAAEGLSLQARYADLIVVGQADPDDRSQVRQSAVPEYVAMNGGCPALIVPYVANPRADYKRVLIAWNASPESLRAVRSAIPLLRRAATVEVAIFNPSARPELFGEVEGSDIALYLARHGVKVDVMKEEVGDEVDVGNALLSLAANLESDMLVMGCYGHSRFREILLGGATRTVLQSMTVPVLMTH